MESLRGELTALYRKQFMKLDAAECAGKNTTRMRIQLLEAYVKDLNEQNEMLVQMVEEATATKDDLSFKGKQQHQQLQKAKGCLEHVNDELDAEREKSGALNCEMANQRKENSRLCRLLEEANREKCLLENRVAELDGMIRKVRQEMCDLERQMDCANREAEDLECCLQQSKSELDKLKQNNCKLENTASRLEDELGCSQKQESELVKKNSELFDEVNSLCRTLQGKEEDIRALHAQVDGLNEELQCTCEKLGCNMEKSDHLTCKNKQLCDKLDCTERKLQDCECAKQNLQQEYLEYKKCHKYTNHEFEDLEDKMLCYKNKLTECDCCLEEKMALVSDLESELCCVKDTLADVETSLNKSNEQVCRLQRDLCSAEEDKVSLERDLREADLKIAALEKDLDCREEELKEYRNCNSQLDSECKDWAETVECRNRAIREWKSTLDTREKEVQEWKCAFEDRENKVHELQEELKCCQKELFRLKNDLRQCDCDVSDLKGERDKLRSELAEACSMYNDMVKRAEALDKDLCASRRKCDELEAEVKDLSCRLETACTEKSFSLQKNSRLEAELELTCSQINDLKSQLNVCERDRCEAQRELQYMDQKCCAEEARLSQEICRLKCELEQELNCRRNLEYQIASKDQLINSLRCTY